MKILILGTTGMLGSMVFDYLSQNKVFQIEGTYRSEKDLGFFKDNIPKHQFDASKDIGAQLKKIFTEFTPNYIINCIGIIKPHCKDDDPEGVQNAIEINALFPHLLTNETAKFNTKIKIIQIATDCVYSGAVGNYNESSPHDPHDVYGKTKSLGEINNLNVLNIRCSIIGPEIKGKHSLLEWFLSQPDFSQIYGFAHHLWNGVTTLQFAQYCNEIITNGEFEKLRRLNNTLHLINNEIVSKYELLNIFKTVFSKNIKIKETSVIGNPVYRTLNSSFLDFPIISMYKAIEDLKKHIDSSVLYQQN